MFVLQYGAERVSKALSLPGGDPAHHYWEPLVGVLVETDAGWLLFDTGMSRANHNSAGVDRIYRGTSGPVQDSPRWHLAPAAPEDR